MTNWENVLHSKIQRELSVEEKILVDRVGQVLENIGGTENDLGRLLDQSDILDIAFSLNAAPEFVTSTGRIDVPPNNDCPTRSGVCSVRLPAGYSYYDHQVIETSANPQPGNITIQVLPTGVDAAWKVPFIGTYIGGFCGGARSWLDAYIIVRGRQSS